MIQEVRYKKGDVLKSLEDENTVIAHACNMQGMWGSGVAKFIGEKFPYSYYEYRMAINQGKVKLGGHYYAHDEYQAVVCLFTSNGYGPSKDSEDRIVANTRTAIDGFIKTASDGLKIVSPKINAGLFRVPWEKTEAIINETLQKYNKEIIWTVYVK